MTDEDGEPLDFEDLSPRRKLTTADLDDPTLSKFERLLLERRAKEEAEAELFADAIPDPGPRPTFAGRRSELIDEIEAMRHDPILAVYDKLVGGRRKDKSTGEIQMQCPISGHPDANPSASMHVESSVWYCYACDVGGSVFDLAGAAWGYSIPLRGEDVWNVKKRYATELHGLDYEAEIAQVVLDDSAVTADQAQVGEMELMTPEAERFEAEVQREVHRMRVWEAAKARVKLEVSDRTHEPIDLSYTLADLLAESDEDMRYTIDRLALYGTNTLILGDSKTGKTAVVMALIRSLVDGIPFLGQFSPRAIAGNVAYLNFEVDRNSSKRRFVELRLVNGTKFRPIALRGRVFDLANPSTFGQMVDQLNANHVEVLILDPWRRVFCGEDENSATQVSKYLDLVDQLKERSGTVRDVFMPCHTGKSPERFKETARGSSAVENWCDNCWTLRKDIRSDGSYDRYFRLSVGRDPDQDDLMNYHRVVKSPLEELTLETPGTRALGSDELKILTYVGTNPGCSQSKANQACGIEQKRGLGLIEDLIKSGHLQIVKAPTRGLADALFVA